MYNDLFGDLPSTKNTTSSSDNSNNNVIKKDTSNDSNKDQDGKNINHDEKSVSTTASIIPAVAATKPLKSKSLVESLGKAGTAVSFVPLALRRKRQPTSTSSTQGKKRQNLNVSSQYYNNNNEKNLSVSITEIKKSTQVKEDEVVMKEGKIAIPSASLSSKEKDEVVLTECETHHLIHEEEQKTRQQHQMHDNDNNEENIVVVESNELQKLHSSVHPYDLYDPMEPNDYLAYRQQKENELIRADLERQARKTLEMQQTLRQRVEEERKKVLETGDVNKIIASSSLGRGRGRGRGRELNNLPAWLVKKQKEKKQDDSQQEHQKLSRQGTENQFDDHEPLTSSPVIREGCTVVLANMVGPSEIDDELKEEVQEECEGKCGKVLNVSIPVEQRGEVKVYVTFEYASDAKKAPTMFDGRMFGNRKISAKLL